MEHSWIVRLLIRGIRSPSSMHVPMTKVYAKTHKTHLKQQPPILKAACENNHVDNLISSLREPAAPTPLVVALATWPEKSMTNSQMPPSWVPTLTNYAVRERTYGVWVQLMSHVTRRSWLLFLHLCFDANGDFTCNHKSPTTPLRHKQCSLPD